MAGVESLGSIQDVELTLTVELDRRSISVGELLQLEIGHVLKFSRPVGEDLDLFAGDVRFGSVEILTVDGKLAARVADLQGGSGPASAR